MFDRKSWLKKTAEDYDRQAEWFKAQIAWDNAYIKTERRVAKEGRPSDEHWGIEQRKFDRKMRRHCANQAKKYWRKYEAEI